MNGRMDHLIKEVVEQALAEHMSLGFQDSDRTVITISPDPDYFWQLSEPGQDNFVPVINDVLKGRLVECSVLDEILIVDIDCGRSRYSLQVPNDTTFAKQFLETAYNLGAKPGDVIKICVWMVERETVLKSVTLPQNAVIEIIPYTANRQVNESPEAISNKKRIVAIAKRTGHSFDQIKKAIVDLELAYNLEEVSSDALSSDDLEKLRNYLYVDWSESLFAYSSEKVAMGRLMNIIGDLSISGHEDDRLWEQWEPLIVGRKNQCKPE